MALSQALNNHKRKQKGQLLVEILLAIALTTIFLPALLTGLFSSRVGKVQQTQRAQAIALLKEAEEVVRNVRNQQWNAFSLNGTYHPLISNDSWMFASGNETINGFTRSVTLSDVYRDTNGIIVDSGGTLDPATKRVHVEVTWGIPYLSSVDSTMFVTRYLNNSAVTQTSLDDFNTGTFATTQSRDTQGGEVTLSTNTKGKWCSPAFSSATISLPDGPPVAVAATSSAASITTPNQVFVATAPTTSTSVKLAHVLVTANTETPTTSLRGTFTLDSTKYSDAGLVPVGLGIDNSYKTNAIKYYRSSSGKMYALIATTKPDREVIAILVDDGNPSNDNTNNGEYQDHVNRIYRYWTYFNTQMFNTSGGSYDTGLVNPSANTTTSGGDNDGFQSSPTRAYTDNNSFAVDTNSGNGTGTNCTGNDKDKHVYYNYNLAVPSGASISGIEVRLDAKVDNTSNTPFMCAQISWDGGTTWTSTKSTTNLTTNEAIYTLGGSSDTWGRGWSSTDFSNSNFRLRVINVSSSTSRDFSLDWAAVKVYYSGGSLNDQAPFDYGGTSLAVLDDKGYVSSGGYLYVFDLSSIDSKTTSSGLDMLGCRIQLDGYDCNPGSGTDRKYSSGEIGTSWSDTTSPAHNDCSDGGNIELYATNDIFPVKVGANTYVHIAVGAGTNAEYNIVDASSIPSSSTSPKINETACGRASGGSSSWKLLGSYDFNSDNGTEEAANSVFGNGDGTRAYISSNGDIDADNNGSPDSMQFYILNTANKNSPTFLSGNPSIGPSSGYYYGNGADAQLYPRRSLTVFDGLRAVLVGKDGTSDTNNSREYQVLNITNESSPAYCGGLQFDSGFNDLTSVSELDGDNFVYMIGNTTDNELKIVQGGPDGTYLSSGTYESDMQNLGSLVVLNRFSVNSSAPPGTTLQFQIAATPAVNQSCTDVTYSFVGPDGTNNSYFQSAGGAIPLIGVSGFGNPAQCVKYKAYFSTTDNNVTPTLYDSSFNYSP